MRGCRPAPALLRPLALGLGLAFFAIFPTRAQLSGLVAKGEANITITPDALSRLCVWTDKATGTKLIYSSGASQCFNGRNFQCKGNQWYEMKGRFDGPCDAEARNAVLNPSRAKGQ